MDQELSKIFNTGPVVIFKWDVNNASLVCVSENVEEVFGYTVSEIILNNDFLYKMIRKENMSVIMKALFELTKVVEIQE